MKMGSRLTKEDNIYNNLKWSLGELEIGLSALKSLKEKKLEIGETDFLLNEEITNIELRISEINSEINDLKETLRKRKDEGMEEYTEQLMWY